MKGNPSHIVFRQGGWIADSINVPARIRWTARHRKQIPYVSGVKG